jgi:urea transport system ATP-binding protein
MVFPRLTVDETILAGLGGASTAAIAELTQLFPVLAEMRKRQGGNLSGGQQQQLVIARALASNPRLLILDEPTEGIQPSIIKELAVTLRRIRDERGLSILVSEQVLSFALAVADRAMVLERGRIVYESREAGIDEKVVAEHLAI